MDKDYIKLQMDMAYDALGDAPEAAVLALALATTMRPIIQEITKDMPLAEMRLFYRCLLSGLGGFIEASMGIGAAKVLMTEQSKLCAEAEDSLREIMIKSGH